MMARPRTENSGPSFWGPLWYVLFLADHHFEDTYGMSLFLAGHHFGDSYGMSLFLANHHLGTLMVCLLHPQNHIRFCSRWLHSDTLLSRSGSSHFRTQIHIPKAIADLLPDGFIWMPFSLDLDQAIFESADASP